MRRALDADAVTGQRRWTDRHFLFNFYQEAELGYAVTDHVAQGRTVTAGLAVITGAEDRPHALVALTRGTTTNLAYVFTQSPKRADPVPWSPARARAGPVRQQEGRRLGVPAPPIPSAPPGQALAVLAAVLNRDGQLLSATQDRHRALANADHLAILHAIWTAETTPAREQRYQDMLSASLPPGYHRPLGHQARWLWRTLRAAELARPGPRPGPGRRDRRTGPGRIPRPGRRAIDARLRHRLGTAVPLPAGPWSGQLPALTDTERPPPKAPTCAACPTDSCCTCATPTPWKPPGPRSTSGMSYARSAPPPGTPAWPPSAPPPRPTPPGPQLPAAALREPPPSSQARRDDLTLTAGEQIPEPGQWIKDLTAQRRAFADRLANHQSLMVPAEDPDYGDLGQAFLALASTSQAADPPTTQTGDPAIRADPRTRRRPRD